MGNQQGKERRDFGRKIDWNNAGKPSSPGKPFLVPADNNRPTDVITIRWSPPVSDGGAPVIGYLVEHRRTGSPHWLRATPDLVPGTELPLTGLEPGWRYQFRVSAENDVGRSEPGDLSEPLTVTPQKWAASAPFFNVELQDAVGLENEKVEFKVQVIAVPPPTIAWYKDGFEVFSSRRTKIMTDNDQSTFIIHQAALEDEGEIKCTATNRAGYAVTKANLKLEAPPRLRLPRQYEDGLIFEKGELIRLKVTTAGRPRPLVHWYHNGEPVEKSGRVEVVHLETGSVIKVRDACRADRGEYTIKGVNKIGEDMVSFLVTVTDRPSPPGKVQISMFGRMATLSWSEPEDDGGCKIGSYIVEYFRVGWEMWLKAKNSRQLSTILEDLIEGSEYKFRVRAENPYGISDPSEESDTVFIPDPKRGIFKPPPKETSAMLKETKQPAEKSEGTEESQRRRVLEEKARRLLDTPIPYLLNSSHGERTTESAESMSDGGVPPPVPKRRKAKGKPTPRLGDGSSSDSQRVSPSPPEGLLSEGRLTPSPVLSKMLTANEMTNGTVEKPEWKFGGENRSERTSMKFMGHDAFRDVGPLYPRENDDSIMHGSSELMLVIYPRDRSKSVELSAQQRSEIEMSLAGDGVAPPMSLSAPELGWTDIFEQPFMRNAVSSTEILYERTAARLYQDSIDEETQRTLRRRYSMDKKSVERRASLKEPLGLNLEKRHSFKGDQEGRETRENSQPSEEPSTNRHPTEESPTRIPKPLSKATRERLSSVEREQLEFALVRDRLKRKEEEQKCRLAIIHHESETSTTTPTSSSADLEDLDEEYNDDDDDDDDDEEEEEGYLDKISKEVGDDFEDGISNMKNELSAIDTRLTVPKPVRIAPFAEREEDTYHPRSMIPTRSVIAKLPAEDIRNITELPAPVHEIPRPMPSSSPEVVPEPTKIKIPIPAKARKTSKILKKLRLKKDKRIPEVLSTPSDQDSPPTVLPKPILKNKIPQKKRESPKLLLKFSHGKPADKSVSEEDSESELIGRKKKQVRIAEPNEEVQKVQEEASVDKNARENQVLIYHYSDIVREFGGNKKPSARLYLNYEELKAHAKDFDKVNSLPSQDETSTGGTVGQIKTERTPEVAPVAAASTQPEVQQVGIHTSLEYLIDVVMFVVACCLYLFKNELYAIPILAIMAYRQLKDMTLEKYEKLKDSAANCIPKKLTGKAENEEGRH